MTGARRRLVVIDAANVVGSRPDGWWRDRAGAARRLIAKVTTYQTQLDADSNDQPVPSESAAELVVVLEGAAKAALDRDHPDAVDNGAGGLVRVVAAAGSGDDAIVEVVSAALDDDDRREITVVTADRGLRERVESLGAQTVGPRWLWDRID